MDRLISEHAVIDTIDKWVKNMGVLIALPANEVTPLFESIHELSSVNPQEPCGDCVNRQAVIDALYELCNTNETLIENPWRDNPHIDALIDAIEELSPVNPQEPKWISVSERLPKSCGMYIVTRKIYDCPDTAPIIMSDESWFDGQNTWHNDNRINHKRGYLSDVIAWMPLPEPYKAESEGEE